MPQPSTSIHGDEDKDPTVYIAVVGDSGTGKTSLITAAASETFPDSPPPVLPPARLPPETTPEGVPVVITDTSSRPEDKHALEMAVQNASVVVLCFAMDQPATLRRVSSHWMPEFRRLGVEVPILLVGCKSDLRPADRSLHQAVLPLVKTFPQIETCMECSARTLQFVGEVFYYALKSVVHPVSPLYEPESQKLRPACARALKCIFKLCDKDGDGLLNDAELNEFQVYCFNAPLQPEELTGIKQVVSEKLEQGIEKNSLTLAGFLFLHALFIERGRLETTWTVLRRFGYSNDLRLRDDILEKASFAGRCADQVVELTPEGKDFLSSTFLKYDVDDDGALSVREREEMFSTAPAEYVSCYIHGLSYLGFWMFQHDRRPILTALLCIIEPQNTFFLALILEIRNYYRLFFLLFCLQQCNCSPWKSNLYTQVMTETTKKGLITLNGFIALWSYTAALDPRGAWESALYLGMPQEAPLERLLTLSRRRQQERRSADEQNRSLLQGFVFSDHQLDTMPLLEGLITQARSTHGPAGENTTIAIASVPIPSLSDLSIAPDSDKLKQEDHQDQEAKSHEKGDKPSDANKTLSDDPKQIMLMLKKIASEDSDAMAMTREKADDLQAADIAIFAFDGTKHESFRAISHRLVEIAAASGDSLPCMLVGIVPNGGEMSATVIAEAGDVCGALCIHPPLILSHESSHESLSLIYKTIASAAIRPHGYIPETPSLKSSREFKRKVRKAALGTAIVVTTGLAGYFAYRLYKSHKRSETISTQ